VGGPVGGGGGAGVGAGLPFGNNDVGQRARHETTAVAQLRAVLADGTGGVVLRARIEEVLAKIQGAMAPGLERTERQAR
jgi:hypothetical protein